MHGFFTHGIIGALLLVRAVSAADAVTVNGDGSVAVPGLMSVGDLTIERQGDAVGNQVVRGDDSRLGAGTGGGPSGRVYVYAVNAAAASVNGGTTNVPFPTEISDAASAWDGSQFFAPRDGNYLLSACIAQTVSGSGSIGIWRNGVHQAWGVTVPALSGAQRMITMVIPLASGDNVSVRSSSSGSLYPNTVCNWITIAELVP